MSTMDKNPRTLVALLTAVLAFLIGLSDYFGWTDYLFGRRAAREGIAKLSSTKGYPEIIIFNDEKEFQPLWKLIRTNTQDDITLSKYREGKIPICYCQVRRDANGPRLVKCQKVVLILVLSRDTHLQSWFFYNYKRGVGQDQSASRDERIARPIGNIGDLKSWIRGSKETERFIFSLLC